MASRQNKENQKELGRFSLVGFGATVIDYSVLNLLVSILGFPLIASNIVSASLSSYFSYMLNKKVVFKGKAHSERRTLLLYIGTLIVSIFVIQSTVLLILGHGLMNNLLSNLGLEGQMLEIVSTNASKVIAGFCTLGWNFLTQRRYVFVSNDESKNS